MGLTVLAASCVTSAVRENVSRDPLRWPFASDSIWNMPVGSDAIYVPAGLSAVPGNDREAPMPQVDDERIVLMPHAPLAEIYHSDAGWTDKDRCKPTGSLLLKAPIPRDYIVPSGPENSSAVLLAADGRTVLQAQPFARCQPGGPATSLVKFEPVDLYGPGISGAHGGSGLSALGGSIRLGELRPGQQGPRHALKVNVYAKESLYRCRTPDECYRWPASTADNYAVGHYGIEGEGINPAMKMGALLAIPPWISIRGLKLETEPGRQLAWTLQNFGAYIVDDTYGPAFAINAESGPNGSVRDQFKADWGFDLEQRVKHDSPWVRDLQTLVKALHVIDNNGPDSIGGGGTPRHKLAPRIAARLGPWKMRTSDR